MRDQAGSHALDPCPLLDTSSQRMSDVLVTDKVRFEFLTGVFSDVV